jgi:TonB family protein
MLNPLRDPPPRTLVRLAAGLLVLIAAALAALLVYFRPTFGFAQGNIVTLGAPPAPTPLPATASTAPSQQAASLAVSSPTPGAQAPDAEAELLSRSVPSAYELFAGCTSGLGVFIMEINVSTSGRVSNARMRRGPGCAIAEKRMLAAARLWRFSPARKQGKAVEATITVSVAPGG